MKRSLTFLFTILCFELAAQKDSIVAGVYRWDNTQQQRTTKFQGKTMVNGSSRDLLNLEVLIITLNPGQKASKAVMEDNNEKLVIVKEGDLTLAINDSIKTLTDAGYAVIIAKDRYRFANNSGKVLTFYILKYTARAPLNVKRAQQAGGSFYSNWADLTVKQTEKGESRPIFDRPTSMFSRFDMHATALNPGIASHDPHSHRAEEIILMIKGEVQVQIGQRFLKATAGDLIFYPANSLHAVKNTGTVQCGYFAIQWRNE